MMGTDRVSIKLDAKSKISSEVKKVTLVYLLIGSLLPSVVGGLWGGASFSELAEFVNYGDPDAAIAFLTSPSWISLYVISLVLSCVLQLFTYGYFAYSMKVARSQQTGGISDIFSMIGQWKKIILLTLYTELLIFLWSLLFVIPGIIAAYRYRMAPYILIDDPDVGVVEAVRRSKEMMNGYKMELFIFDLSFFGWALLVSLIGSIGTMIGNMMGVGIISIILEFAFMCILNLWLQGYMFVAEMNYYDVISGQMHYHGGENTQNNNFWSEPGYNGYSAPTDGPNDPDDPWN